MQYIHREHDPNESDGLVYNSLEPLIRGMGMALIELTVFKSKGKGKTGADTRRSPAEATGSVQIRAVVYKNGITGIEDCSRVHRAIFPRLELAFPGADLYLEVSSPGIERIIKDGREFKNYIGRGVRCYRTDISDWTAGILLSADEEKVVLGKEDKETALPYTIIAKARLSID